MMAPRLLFGVTVSVVAPPSARWMACSARALLSSMIPEFRQRSSSNFDSLHQTAQRAQAKCEDAREETPNDDEVRRFAGHVTD
jgi:hypothetical protein